MYSFPQGSPATRHERRADWKKKRAARSFLLTTIEKGCEFQREHEDIFARATPSGGPNSMRSSPALLGSGHLPLPTSRKSSPKTSPRTSPKDSPRVVSNASGNHVIQNPPHIFLQSPSPKRPSLKKFLGALKHTVSESNLSPHVNQTTS